MLQARIEPRQTLRQLEILTNVVVIISESERSFYVYIFMTYTTSATGVLSSEEELCIYASLAAGNSQLLCSTRWGV